MGLPKGLKNITKERQAYALMQLKFYLCDSEDASRFRADSISVVRAKASFTGKTQRIRLFVPYMNLLTRTCRIAEITDYVAILLQLPYNKQGFLIRELVDGRFSKEPLARLMQLLAETLGKPFVHAVDLLPPLHVIPK